MGREWMLNTCIRTDIHWPYVIHEMNLTKRKSVIVGEGNHHCCTKTLYFVSKIIDIGQKNHPKPHFLAQTLRPLHENFVTLSTIMQSCAIILSSSLPMGQAEAKP